MCLFWYSTTYLYENSLPVFFFLGLSQAFTPDRGLQETCPPYTILVHQFLHLSQCCTHLNTSCWAPRGADAPTSNNLQIIPNLLSEFRSVRKHVPLRSKVNPITTTPLPFFPFGKVEWVTADDAQFFWLALRVAVSSDKFSPWAIYWGIT